MTSEAFAVAWQRLDDLPADPDDARAWMFGIARRLLLAEQRAENRGRALSVRIAGHLAVAGQEPDHDDLVAVSVDLATAWTRLSAIHQEALSLSVWEGLTGAQSARVLGISAVAFRIRLSRARKLLRNNLGNSLGEVPVIRRRTPATSDKGYV